MKARSAATISLVPHAPTQTLFRSANVDVAGFPNAVVVDGARLKTVNAAYADKWAEVGEELENYNKEWWNSTVLPGGLDSVWGGVSADERNNEMARVVRGWSDFLEHFNCIPEQPPDELNTALSEDNILVILDANSRFAVQPTDVWDITTHLTLKDHLFEKLSWLSYISLPEQKTEEKKSPTTKGVKPESNAFKPEEILKLNDAASV